MNFNSAQFLVFLPIVVLLNALLIRNRTARVFLLLFASYFFYMCWDWRYAGLIAFSTLVDYYVGLRFSTEERSGHRKFLLIISLSVNLGLLAVFKYFNFFIDSAEGLASLAGIQFSLPHSDLLLPVGISFYTFQTLSYSIDVYRRQIPHESSLPRFALFVSFFPQLVAGPIVRASHFLPKVLSNPPITRQGLQTGLFLVFQGLFKKVVLADLLATLAVDEVFSRPGDFSSVDLLFALYGYAFQIYNDFSGYSDIAIGSALMLGFDLPINFNRPYISMNVREFWTRWHISLSSWLRDYLYIPLGGGRAKLNRVRFNLMLTMLLGGLWHGASWNFVLWGAFHGLLLLIAHRAPGEGANRSAWQRFLLRFQCFHLVLFSWLLFRIQSMPQLWEYLSGLGSFTGGTQIHPFYYLILAAACVIHFTPQAWPAHIKELFLARAPLVQGAAYAGLILLLVGLTLGGPQFIYFQF